MYARSVGAHQPQPLSSLTQFCSVKERQFMDLAVYYVSLLILYSQRWIILFIYRVEIILRQFKIIKNPGGSLMLKIGDVSM